MHGRVAYRWLICPQYETSESIKWRQWTGGGNKAVYCHRWGRVCNAVEAVGPAGGTSSVKNEAGPCLRALSMINWICDCSTETVIHDLFIVNINV